MFDDVGENIKGLAKVLCWIGIIASVIWGIMFIERDILTGVLIAVIGSLVSWLSSFTLYGFGELIEKTVYTHEDMENVNSTIAAIDSKLYFQAEEIKAINKKLSNKKTESNPNNSEAVNKCQSCGCVTPNAICPLCGEIIK